MGARRTAREVALQVLYILDITKFPPAECMNVFWDNNDYSQEIRSFATSLIEGTLTNIKEIDNLIIKYTKNWDLERMASIDRNILREAIYEMVFWQKTPVSVVINEAVELAKKFSTADSGGFVNGILDKVKEVREDSHEPNGEN